MKGYIKLYRDITDHWIWQEKPFSPGQAWVDILMLVNHETKKFLLGKELVLVERGSCITSELKLMERWGWSKTKVRNFLDMLSKDKMIVKKTDRKKTTITVCNYNDWQDSETTEKPQKNHEKTTEKPQKDTNKNILLYSITQDEEDAPVDNSEIVGKVIYGGGGKSYLLINGEMTEIK